MMLRHAHRAVAVDDLQPGSEAWLKVMTASKVAAVLGVSEWTSPYALWRLMRGDVAPDAQTNEQSRGHYLEEPILHWFQDQHPELDVRPNTTAYAHPDRPWQVCTPDAFAYNPEGALVGVINAKTSAKPYEWGTPGTDEIPIEYKVQGIWECDVIGVDTCFVPVLGSYLSFSEYRVTHHSRDAAWMRKQCRDFMATIEAGTPPELGAGHLSTVKTLRKLHPQIDDRSVELPDALWAAYVDAIQAEAQHVTDKAAAEAAVLEFMGTAQRATYLEQPIATRRSKQGGLPYLAAARGLKHRSAA